MTYHEHESTTPSLLTTIFETLFTETCQGAKGYNKAPRKLGD